MDLNQANLSTPTSVETQSEEIVPKQDYFNLVWFYVRQYNQKEPMGEGQGTS